jgi:hypothetical protein
VYLQAAFNDLPNFLSSVPLLPSKVVLSSVAVRKDVDGLHPLNLAQLATTQTHRNPLIEGRGFANPVAADPVWSSVGFPVACTPLG